MIKLKKQRNNTFLFQQFKIIDLKNVQVAVLIAVLKN